MEIKPHMSLLQLDLVAEINRNRGLMEAIRLLRLHPKFKKIAPSVFYRWLSEGGAEKRAVPERIELAILLLNRERERAVSVEMSRLLDTYADIDIAQIRKLIGDVLGPRLHQKAEHSFPRILPSLVSARVAAA